MLKEVRWRSILTAVTASLVFVAMGPVIAFTQEPIGSSVFGAGAGSIMGEVRYEGDPPAPTVVSMTQDAFCIASHSSETIPSKRLVVNNNGTLRWVFIYIREAITGTLPVGEPAPVILDKVGCVYQPHVLGMQAGASIRIVNSDPTLHTVHLVAANNPSFNIALPQPGMNIERVLDAPEVMIPVRCNVHPWTQAYIGVIPHAFFATTGENGRFVIDGVPPGAYVLEAWHELLGRQVIRVVVEDEKESETRFNFTNRN